MKKAILILTCSIVLGACRQISQTVADTFHPKDTIIPRRSQPPPDEVTYSDHQTVTTTSTSISITTDLPLISAKDSLLLVKALKMYEQQAAQSNGADTTNIINITINGHQLRLTPPAGKPGERYTIRFEKDSGAVKE